MGTWSAHQGRGFVRGQMQYSLAKMSRHGTSRLVGLVVVGWALVAPAQPSPPSGAGVVRIIGRVPQILALQFHSQLLVGEGVAGTQSASSLNYTLDVGAVVPGQDPAASAFRGGTVTLILRANTSYLLTATVTGSGFVPSPDYIQLSDIGFGILQSGIVPSGPLGIKTNASLLPAFDSDPFTAPISDGVPAFRATLKDISNGMALLGGGPISRRGSAIASTNGLLVPTKYAVYPQLFHAQDAFAATVTYTLTAP